MSFPGFSHVVTPPMIEDGSCQDYTRRRPGD